MMNKLKNLSNWLEGSGFKKESSLVSGMLVSVVSGMLASGMLSKLGSGIPEELQGVFDDEELGSLPPSSGGQDAPESLREVKELFSPEELGGTSAEILKDRILYEQERLRKGPHDDATSELVKEIQSLLKKHGYTLPGHGADGIFGNETEKAVIEFQKNNKNSGLVESGEIDASTLIVLQSEIAVKKKEIDTLESAPKNIEAPRPTSKISGRAGRAQLANMSLETKDKLYKLTQAEVGGQGARAQQAFMETVANRSTIQGKTIDFTVSDRRYYQPIKGEGKSINTLRAVSDTTKAKYDKILDKVIEGSNITNGATHNASAGVAKKVTEGGYNAKTSSIIVIGGETFYSKTYEQKKIKRLDASPSPDSSANSFEQNIIPPPQRPKVAGEYTLPKVSFVSVPCVSAARLAVREAKEQWDNGNISEADPRAEVPIQKYYAYTSKHNGWKNNIDRWGTGRRGPGSKHEGKKQMNPVKTRDENGVATDWHHWSAVYVSWIMKQYDGEGATWFASEGHSVYIRDCKKKRKEIESHPRDHIGKMYYVWFTKEEMDKYGMRPEPGDVIGRNKHCDIYVGGNQIIGGNTCAKNEDTGNRKKNCKGTSGPKPLRWLADFGIIKRVRVTGPGSDGMLVA